MSMIPTHANVRNLAESLGRSDDAIYTIFELAYSGNWLKNTLRGMKENQDNVATKIARTKKKLGIFIGYNPK